MTAAVPWGAGLFSRILVELIQVRCSGMAEKREAPVNKVSQSKGWRFNHRVIVLMPQWVFVAFTGETATWWKKRSKLSLTIAGSRRRSWAKLQVPCCSVCDVFTKLLQLIEHKNYVSLVGEKRWNSCDWFEFNSSCHGLIQTRMLGLFLALHLSNGAHKILHLHLCEANYATLLHLKYT